MTVLRPAVALQGFPLLPTAILVFLGSLWGFGFSLVKLATQHGVPPLAYVFWQSFGAGVALFAVTALRGGLPAASSRLLLYCVVAGITGLALPNALGAIAVTVVPAGLMSVIISLSALMTAVMARAMRIESLDRQKLAGLLLGFAGVLLILLPRTSLPSPDMLRWVLLAMLVPLCYAASNVLMTRYRPAGIDSLALASGMLLCSAALLLPAVLVTGSWHPIWRTLGPGELANLAHMALTAAAYYLWFELLRLGGPTFSSQVGYVVTATGLGWGMYIFGERHSLWIWLAVLLIVAGVALVGRRR
jgi:drug/metabolite transporter (DMT)-like permease